MPLWYLRGLWFNHHHHHQHHHHHHHHQRSSSLEDGHREQNITIQVLQNHDHDNLNHDHHHDHHKTDTVSKTLLFSFFIMGPAAFIFGTPLGWASSVTTLHVRLHLQCFLINYIFFAETSLSSILHVFETPLNWASFLLWNYWYILSQYSTLIWI